MEGIGTDSIDDALAEAKAIISNADRENREITAEESDAIDALVGRVEDLKAQAETRERMAALARPAGRRTLPDPIQGGFHDAGGGAGASSIMLPGTVQGRGTGRRFVDLFGAHVARSSDGWKGFDQFINVIASGRHHDRLRNASMTEGVGADGGFLVPTQYLGDLLDAALPVEVVRPRATVVPMTTHGATAPGLDVSDHTGGSIAGLTGQWLAEGAAGTEQKAAFRAINLVCKKLAIFAKATNELVSDAPNFALHLFNAISSSIGFSLDKAFIQGTGAGMPLGIMRDPALITVTKETSQTAATITYINVIKMLSRLHPACYNNAIWLASPTTIPQLLRLFMVGITDLGAAMTNAGGPVLVMDGDGTYRLLGRPVVFTEHMSVLGTVGDLILADLSQYVIGLRAAGSIQRAQEPGWLTDQESFRLILRVDGQGKWSDPITPLNGSTLSWCVALETR